MSNPSMVTWLAVYHFRKEDSREEDAKVKMSLDFFWVMRAHTNRCMGRIFIREGQEARKYAPPPKKGRRKN